MSAESCPGQERLDALRPEKMSCRATQGRRPCLLPYSRITCIQSDYQDGVVDAHYRNIDDGKGSMQSECHSTGWWHLLHAEVVRSFCIPPWLWEMRLNASRMSAKAYGSVQTKHHTCDPSLPSLAANGAAARPRMT